MDAIAVYRQRFRPSAFLDRPHLMLGVNIVAADTDEEAKRLFTSHQQAFVNLRRGTLGPLPPPNPRFISELSPQERHEIDHTLSTSMIGSIGTVQSELETFIRRTQPDELIVVSTIYDHVARLRSYEFTAGVIRALPNHGLQT